MTARHSALPVLLLTLLASLAWGQTPPADRSQEALNQGRKLVQEGKSAEAVKILRKADKLAGGSCVECHINLAVAFNQMGNFKEAQKSAATVLKLSQKPADQFRAYHNQGLALYGLAGDDPAKMKPAEDSFRRALELSAGKSNSSRFSLAMALLRQSRDEEGVALLKQYLEQEPGATDAARARELIANPVRARKNFFPDFELFTLAGDRIGSKNLRGKVVLVDFWGTWCPPCVAAVPSLRTMSKRMTEEPFVLLSISNDQDRGVLKAFVERHEMKWPQVWDQGGAFTHKCKISSFPTYVLVSHEGEILYSVNGWSTRIERDLGKKVSSAVQAAKSVKSK
jgi:thioredoxin-like negative regulator of GroEL